MVIAMSALLPHANRMSQSPSQLSVTAAEITRNFGMWQDRASLGPVVVTHHGRARCVLLSANSYEQLSMTSEPGLPVGSQDGLLMQVLAERIDLAFIVLDHQFHISETNTAAAILLGARREDLLAKPLQELWPDFGNSVAEAQIRRAMRTGDTVQVRIHAAAQSIDVKAFPWPGGLGLLVRAAGRDEQLEDVTARASTIDRLLALDGRMGMIRLSARGTIAEADAAFCAMIQIPVERLCGARLPDLALRDNRATVSGLIEDTLSNAGEGRCDAMLIDNDGREIPVHLTFAAIRDGLGSGGALVMVRDCRTASTPSG